jgi:hypothetical protein
MKALFFLCLVIRGLLWQHTHCANLTFQATDLQVLLFLFFNRKGIPEAMLLSYVSACGIITDYSYSICFNKKLFNRILTRILARHQWFTPVILATWEAEIKRIVVQRQPQANS